MTNNPLVAEFENTTLLELDDYARVVLAGNAKYTSLDDAEDELRENFPNWFVYRGGSHVALHTKSGGDRVLLIKEVRPVEPNAAGIEAGDNLSVFVNQGLREAEVLAVRGDEYLVEYTMPKGTTALLVLNSTDLPIVWKGREYPDPTKMKSVSYFSLSRKWLQAVVDAGGYWIGNPQSGGKHGKAPVASELLAAKA